MRILLTNDDGVYAAGIRALAAALRGKHEVTIAAPSVQRSGASHSFTCSEFGLSAERVTLEGLEDVTAYAISGTPSDCAKLGMHFTACTTPKYFPDKALVETCEKIARQSGATITLTDKVEEGTKGADVIYTDVWVSMGEPAQVWEERIKELSPYQVNRKVMENAGENAIFMHCLPAFHDLKTKIGKEMGEKFGVTEMEVTDEVFESPQSVVFDEAENRMHTIKAVMAATL